MGINFFFTFPTSEGSDLLSSHVMQTPTFISKLSDGNVIFRLDVGKIPFREDFPCHSTWKRCKHSGHFSRFRNISGNVSIIKQKCYVIMLLI
jgi:hypothetical protein